MMAGRTAPLAPFFYLYIKSADEPTYRAHRDLLHDLRQVLDTNKYLPCGFSITLPRPPPVASMHDVRANNSAWWVKGRVHTPWPLATDFVVPAAALYGGITSTNSTFMSHLAQSAVPHLMDAYASRNLEGFALALCDLAPGGPGRACCALEAAIEDAGGAGAMVVRVSVIATDRIAESAAAVEQRRSEAELQFQQGEKQLQQEFVELQRRYVEKDRQLATHRRVLALLQRECAEVEQLQAEFL
jgi:hypothetical protein